jgi:signal transduction histidine kinase
MRAARRDEDDPRKIVDAFARRWRESGAIDIRADIEVTAGELPRETEELFARVLREALRNIELHSGARGVSVELRRRGAAARLDILDDGVGFDTSAPTPGHYGVEGMRERARLAGASLDIVSAPGKGTRVTLAAPILEGESRGS